jgi:hypothetical protein
LIAEWPFEFAFEEEVGNRKLERKREQALEKAASFQVNDD